MKYITLILFLLTFSSYGQQNFERKTYIEINERASFFEVNNRREILSDTLFYCTSGFLVDAEYGIHIDNMGKEYVILTYPNYKDSITQINNKFSDSSYTINQIRFSGVHIPINGINNKILMIEKEKFEKLSKATLYNIGVFNKGNYKITTGLLTIPFKLRPKQDTTNFKMTTDVTLGPYFGITKRLSKRNNYYATIPATLGLSFINLNNSTTTISNSSEIGVLPGFSWSSGLILQFDNFSLGYVFGQDYASGIGSKWIYQGKTWHSFAIGYNFIKSDNNKQP